MDSVLYFVSDLLYANKNNLGLTYGSKKYTSAQVKTALSAGIVFIPLSNPDGVAYDQSTNSCWRKNRSPASGTGSSAGVDLNRNFDFVWDFQKFFASSVQSSVASTSPSSETFHGTGAFSEPETKSIKWVFDTYSKVRWFVDLHSYAGDVLYSWGSDDDQTKYSSHELPQLVVQQRPRHRRRHDQHHARVRRVYPARATWTPTSRPPSASGQA